MRRSAANIAPFLGSSASLVANTVLTVSSIYSRFARPQLLVKTWGTHFVLLEYPEEVGERIEQFLVRDLDKAPAKEKKGAAKRGRRSTSRGRGRNR